MIRDFENKHKGETCIIIGNGPSLCDVSLDFLKSYPSFGQNKIFLLNGFTPTYYVATNKYVLNQCRKEINAMQCPKFIKYGYRYIKDNKFVTTSEKIFSKRPDIVLNEGYTVTYVSLQLAYYMGFTTVLLVGVDHRYKYNGNPNEATLMTTDDPNHFSPDYFKGQVWNNPDLVKSEEYYKMADYEYRKDNRRIVNLTPNTALNVFQIGALSFNGNSWCWATIN